MHSALMGEHGGEESACLESSVLGLLFSPFPLEEPGSHCGASKNRWWGGESSTVGEGLGVPWPPPPTPSPLTSLGLVVPREISTATGLVLKGSAFPLP